MESKILDYLSKLDSARAASKLDLETHLFENGILDSFGLVELVAFLEGATGLSITAEDVDDPRFTSVAGIASVLAAKMNAKG